MGCLNANKSVDLLRDRETSTTIRSSYTPSIPSTQIHIHSSTMPVGSRAQLRPSIATSLLLTWRRKHLPVPIPIPVPFPLPPKSLQRSLSQQLRIHPHTKFHRHEMKPRKKSEKQMLMLGYCPSLPPPGKSSGFSKAGWIKDQGIFQSKDAGR